MELYTDKNILIRLFLTECFLALASHSYHGLNTRNEVNLWGVFLFSARDLDSRSELLSTC